MGTLSVTAFGFAHCLILAPQPDDLVFPCSSQQGPVRAERHGSHRAGMAGESTDRFPGRCLPDPDGLLLSGAREQDPVRAERHGI